VRVRPPLSDEMSKHRELVVAFFADRAAAESAARSVVEEYSLDPDEVAVLVPAAYGDVEEHQVGDGFSLRGLNLSEDDTAWIAGQLHGAGAGVGVRSDPEAAADIGRSLEKLGGT
jgi:hypothetical protein